MRTRILLTSMAVAALALTGCNKDENGTNELQNGELRLSSGITVQTRTFGIDEQINNGQSVAVYVDKNADNAKLYGNNELTADGSGKLTGTTMYFPEDRGAVNIYAFVTNATLGDDFPMTAITHSVSAIQKQTLGYAYSDLLYSTKVGQAFIKQAVPLTFYHMLSKVEVALKKGAGDFVLDDATVEILNTKLKADFTPSKTVDMDNSDKREEMIEPTGDPNDAEAITIGAEVTTDWNNIKWNEAVIVPQTLAGGTAFIKVALKVGGELFYRIPAMPAAGITFKSGKRYQYKITVNLTELAVTSTIENWDPVNAVDGNAEME